MENEQPMPPEQGSAPEDTQNWHVGDVSEYFYPSRHKGWQTGNRLCLSVTPPKWVNRSGNLYDNPGEDAAILQNTGAHYRYRTDEQVALDYRAGRFRAAFKDVW